MSECGVRLGRGLAPGLGADSGVLRWLKWGLGSGGRCQIYRHFSVACGICRAAQVETGNFLFIVPCVDGQVRTERLHVVPPAGRHYHDITRMHHCQQPFHVLSIAFIRVDAVAILGRGAFWFKAISLGQSIWGQEPPEFGATHLYQQNHTKSSQNHQCPYIANTSTAEYTTQYSGTWKAKLW